MTPVSGARHHSRSTLNRAADTRGAAGQRRLHRVPRVTRVGPWWQSAADPLAARAVSADVAQIVGIV